MRVAGCSLLSIALTSSMLLAGSNSAAATATATPFQLVHATSQTTTAVDTLAVTNALSDYYENIVDQVMATLTEEITLSAPHSFMSIHHLGSVHRSKCRTSFRYFVHALRDHLNLMRSNLLASIRPLVESNLPAVLEHKDNAHQHTIATNAEVAGSVTGTTGLSGLTEDILILNRHIGNQLGLIVNMDEAAEIIINQSIPASLFEEYAQQEAAVVVVSHQRWRASRNEDQFIVMGGGGQQRQQQQQQDETVEDMMADPTVWLDALRREQEEQQQQEQRPESKVLSNWLRSWLAEIEHIISVQFDERVQDATQSILEDFLLDE